MNRCWIYEVECEDSDEDGHCEIALGLCRHTGEPAHFVPGDFDKGGRYYGGEKFCPKCGSKMAEKHYPEHNESHYECRCGYQLVHLSGHEKKVGGEKDVH